MAPTTLVCLTKIIEVKSVPQTYLPPNFPPQTFQQYNFHFKALTGNKMWSQNKDEQRESLFFQLCLFYSGSVDNDWPAQSGDGATNQKWLCFLVGPNQPLPLEGKKDERKKGKEIPWWEKTYGYIVTLWRDILQTIENVWLHCNLGHEWFSTYTILGNVMWDWSEARVYNYVRKIME